jgi:hypothetical protein
VELFDTIGINGVETGDSEHGEPPTGCFPGPNWSEIAHNGDLGNTAVALHLDRIAR